MDKRNKIKSRKKPGEITKSLIIIAISSLIISIYSIFNFYQYNNGVKVDSIAYSFLSPSNVVIPSQSSEKSIKFGTFFFITPTIISTITPTMTPTPTQQQAINTPTPPRGNPPVGKQYCVDEAPGTVLIESCDDATRCDVAHGGGGPYGTCGTVISWEHTIIESLLGSTGRYNNRLSNNLSVSIQSSCYTALPWSPYISTFNVIDSYNLAGFREFSRGTHADATALANAWGGTAGYTVSTTTNGLTPGDVVLFSKPPHVGIVNTVEIDTRGNGDIWFLHTNAAYYLGKLIVANRNVVASSTGDKNVKFGSHTTKGADATIGETVCYCGRGVCYRWVF